MSTTTPVVAGAFDPSGQSYAYIYRALEAFHLKVVPVVGNSESVEFVAGKGIQLTCLLWIPFSPNTLKQSNKKRKKQTGSDEALDYAVALGTNSGQVLVFSPLTNQVQITLQSSSKAQILDLSFYEDHLFAIQDDGLITQWNCHTQTEVHKSQSPCEGTSRLLHTAAGAVVASTSPALIGEEYSVKATLPGFASAIVQLSADGSDSFLGIAENDRMIQAYSYDQQSSLGTFSCPSNAQHVSLSSDNAAFAVVAEDGKVYIFKDPFESQATSITNKKKKKSASSRKPDLEIQYQRPNGLALPVFQTRFVDDFITVSYLEHGQVVVFDRVRWRSADKSVLSEPIKVVKDILVGKVEERLSKGADPAAAKSYNEASASVVSGYHVSSLEDPEEAEETLADRLDALDVSESDSSDGDLSGDDIGEDGAASRSAIKSERRRQSRQSRKERKLKLSAPGTFSAMLTQALVSDDKQLLEECLNVADEAMIKASIIKLEPALASALLEKLAERIARVQHRAGVLSQWAKWVMIIHGSYLVTVPNLMKSLASFYATLNNRVSNLPRLQALQGRLELLDYQLDIRREVSSREIENDADEVPEFVYDDAVTINGEEDFDDDEPAADSGSDNVAIEVEDDEEVMDSEDELESDSDAGSYVSDQSSDMDVSDN